MLALQPLRDKVLESDDGVNAEDLFRRAAFSWAMSTKKLVESSVALGANTKIAYAALVDIEYARDLLDKLFVPTSAKVPAAFTERASTITAKSVKKSVTDLADRVVTLTEPQVHRGVDLSAPVHSKNGKMLWADVDCPVCPSKAHQRCRRDDGAFMEKPHPPRKDIWLK